MTSFQCRIKTFNRF